MNNYYIPYLSILFHFSYFFPFSIIHSCHFDIFLHIVFIICTVFNISIIVQYIFMAFYCNNIETFRALMFVHNNFGGEIGVMELMDIDRELLVMVNRELKTYINNLEHIK